MNDGRILVYGFGNPGREDDGLGVALASMIAAERISGVDVDADYQLNPEDALEVADHEMVIFTDASKNAIDGFRFSRLDPEDMPGFSSHAMTPGGVLALCKELYDRIPGSYMLEIQGHSWELQEGLTEKAGKSLKAAFIFLKSLLNCSSPVQAAAQRAA